MNIKNFLSFVVGFVLFFTVSALSAQSNAEIEAAKALAKKYGYSDAEIEALINGQKGTNVNNMVRSQESFDRMSRQTMDTLSVTSIGMKLVPEDFELKYEQYVQDSLHSLIYGHDLFRKAELNFVPSYNIPTPENYRFAPGDQVIISVWGASNETIDQVISPEGSINVPNVGPVYLMGKSLVQAQNYLKEQLGRSYSGLLGGNPNTFLSLSLGKMRSLTVNVVGDVTRPGTVTLPSLSNITSALYLAGGPSLTGSVREIKLYRGGKLVSSFDSYDYMLNGKYDTNIRLEDNDLIVVSPYTNLVYVTGQVKRPMKYEMTDSESVADVLKFSGGFAGGARSENVYLSRVKGEGRVSFTIESKDYDMFTLMDGDSLFVASNKDLDQSKVNIEGAVWYQGDYAISNELTRLSDLLKLASVREDAYQERVFIKRFTKEMEKISLYISLEDVLNGRDNVELHRMDSVKVFSISEMIPITEVLVRGEVNNPTPLEFRKGMTLGDAILLAGGFNLAATRSFVEVARRNKNDNAITVSDTISTVFSFDLIENPEDFSFPLTAWDIITVRKAPDYKEQQTISVTGEVVFPGYHTVEKNVVRVSDIIKKTRGFTNDAYLKGATLSRMLTDEEYERMLTAWEIAKERTGDTTTVFDITPENARFRIAFDLEEAINNPGSYADIVLRTGDVINIPKLNSTVKISGGVLYANTVAFNPKWGYKRYVDQAGGFLKNARRNRAYIVYMNGTVATKRGGNFKIEPGCEIVVPQKEIRNERRISVAEVMAVTSSAASVASVAVTMVRMLSNP